MTHATNTATDTQPLAKASIPFTLRDMINMTVELKDLLSDEIELLKVMSVKEMKQHHEKKMRLISSLEVMKNTIQKHPELKAGFDAGELQEFRGVSEEFEDVMLCHYRHLNAARTVNGLVVEAIKETVMEQLATPSYGESGGGQKNVGDMAIRINETI